VLDSHPLETAEYGGVKTGAKKRGKRRSHLWKKKKFGGGKKGGKEHRGPTSLAVD